MEKIIITRSARETQKFAAGFAKNILREKAAKKAIVIGLIGELGSGKTTFIQGFAKGLGIRDIITSPTFVIFKCFKFQVSGFKNFIHLDAYRIEKAGELIGLGFKNLICNRKNIILIEWADRIRKILPKSHIEIRFEHLGKNKRKITLKIPND